MDILLTIDELVNNIWHKVEGQSSISHLAATQKLVAHHIYEWGNERCDKHWANSRPRRRECFECWAELGEAVK